jgi:hypothetical protein
LGNNAVTNIFAGVGTGATFHSGYAAIEKDLRVDNIASNNGTYQNGLQFGAGGTGEAIGSNRNTAVNQWGLDFYTNYTNRMSIANNGYVGIGTTAPAASLDVNGTTTTNGLQVGNGTVFAKMQSGVVSVGSNPTGQKTVTITFPVAFSSTTPKVFATARNEPASNFGDAFLCL